MKYQPTHRKQGGLHFDRARNEKQRNFELAPDTEPARMHALGWLCLGALIVAKLFF